MRIVDVCKASIKVGLAYRKQPDSWLPIMFDECQRLGGLYIKFLQQLATTEMASVQLKMYGKHLSVFDDVEYESIDLGQTLEKQLGDKVKLLKITENKPFASGSFAQVYRAEYRGRPVILKVLRPSIAKTLSLDTKLLIFLCNLAQPFLRSGLLNLPNIAREFVVATKRETNYEHEAMVAEYLRGYYETKKSRVVIPQTYKELSTNKLIVQDYIEGMKLTTAVAHGQAGGDTVRFVKEQTGSDIRQQLAEMGSELLISITQADYIMADPHPGNIFLLGDNKIAMIDFGLAAPRPKYRAPYVNMIVQYRALYEDRVNMGSLAIAMMAFYDYQLYQALAMVTDDNTITSRLKKFITVHASDEGLDRDRLAVRRQISQLFLQKINKNNRFAIHMNESEAVLQKAMHGFLGTSQLVFGSQARSSYYFQTVHAALVRADEAIQEHGVTEQLISKEMTTEHAAEIVSDWLSDIAERDSKTYINIMKEVHI
jgi:predicted unusual protein kinase regulating ubiquinone biosynthesis (AarF/ABC1/UbiB family)